MLNSRLSLAGVCVTGLLLASQAQAALTVDLRFAGDGDLKSRAVGANTQFTINVYARVTGTDSNGANDGINFLYGAVQSEQINGGSVVGGSGVGVTSFALQTAFNAPGPSSVAALSNTSPDAIGDWGVPSASITSIKPATSLFGRGYIGDQSNGSTIQGSLVGQGNPGAVSEYFIGSFVFSTGATVSDTGTTAINWLKPTYTAFNPKFHSIYLDGSTINPTGTGNFGNTYLQSSSNGVLLTPNPIPEPATLGVAVVVSVGLLSRRRRRAV